jgi:glutathione S-transferase
MPVVLHGPVYSTYARTVRLALEEKGVPYELNEVHLLGGEGQKPEHLARHPWGKAPAFEHDGFALFETFAIARYVDEAFPGPRLQPEDVHARARMTQICGVLDSYAYQPMVLRVFWQSAIVPMQGGTPDRAIIAEALPKAEQALKALEDLSDGCDRDGFLCGGAFSLADCHLVPMLDYFAMTEDGRAVLSRYSRLSTWWERIQSRSSVAQTRPQLG